MYLTQFVIGVKSRVSSFKELGKRRELKFKVIEDDVSSLVSSHVDLLYKLSRYFNNPVPFWSGCMQLIYDKQPTENCETSSVYFLPILLI